MQITRAHLRKAVMEGHWDLLDRLLEIDSSAINDNSLFTDTWGLRWGLLMECVRQDQVTGVSILLQHGANRGLSSWGDGQTSSPLSVARDRKNSEIEGLLSGSKVAQYTRFCDPPVPPLDETDQAINRKGELLKSKGLIQ